MCNTIDEFWGPYRWLSNFWMCDIVYEGIKYTSTEAAYQAAKTLDVSDRQMIANAPTPKQAKHLVEAPLPQGRLTPSPARSGR